MAICSETKKQLGKTVKQNTGVVRGFRIATRSKLCIEELCLSQKLRLSNYIFHEIKIRRDP